MSQPKPIAVVHAAFVHADVERMMRPLVSRQSLGRAGASFDVLAAEASIGPRKSEWNDSDNPRPRIRLLHDTERWGRSWTIVMPADTAPCAARGFARRGRWRRVPFPLGPSCR